MKRINIVFAGEGGQGIQTIAKIFSEGLVELGFQTIYLPSFGVEQRGTPSVAFVSFSDDILHYSKFDYADYVIVLQKRAIKSIKRYISPNSNVIFDSSTINEKDLPNNAIKIFGVPATKYANEKFNPKSFNILILGYVSQVIKLDSKTIWELCKKFLGSKFTTEKIENENKEAFLFGTDLIAEKNDFSAPLYRSKHKKNIFCGHGKYGEIHPDHCKGCGICILKCPVGALSWGEDLGIYGNQVPVVDLEKCILCGNCLNFCPDGAIAMFKSEKPTKK